MFDQLAGEFGRDELFMDLEDHIPAGGDFVERLRREIAQCEAMLVCIGPRWAAADETGRRRIDDDQDFVRYEIATALTGHKRIIPVLVGNAAMPAIGILPDDIATLAKHQAVRVRFDQFRSDVERLIAEIRSIPHLSGAGPRSPVQRVLDLATELVGFGGNDNDTEDGVRTSEPEDGELHRWNKVEADHRLGRIVASGELDYFAARRSGSLQRARAREIQKYQKRYLSARFVCSIASPVTLLLLEAAGLRFWAAAVASALIWILGIVWLRLLRIPAQLKGLRAIGRIAVRTIVSLTIVLVLRELGFFLARFFSFSLM